MWQKSRFGGQPRAGAERKREEARGSERKREEARGSERKREEARGSERKREEARGSERDRWRQRGMTRGSEREASRTVDGGGRGGAGARADGSVTGGIFEVDGLLSTGCHAVRI
jgi:hypothetical protein